MKYFLDTEFIESGPSRPVELLSIGIVAEDGREFYAVNGEADLSHANEWVRQNVLPHLGTPKYDRDLIAQKILNLVGDDKPEFWGYYADYDWVVFCQIFGSMIDLPKGWPMYCRDLKQLCDSLGNARLPKQEFVEHNALNDARWNKLSYEFLLAGSTATPATGSTPDWDAWRRAVRLPLQMAIQCLTEESKPELALENMRLVDDLLSVGPLAGSTGAEPARVQELEAVIERDRTAIAEHITNLRKELESREWLTEGRGSYEWDDDRYRQEFLWAGQALRKAMEPLVKIAADLSNSPKTQEEVVRARMGAEPAPTHYLIGELKCNVCGDSFKDERGLEQHFKDSKHRLDAEPAPTEDRCLEFAGHLIAGTSSFACVLPKGHEPSTHPDAINGHVRGGKCTAHGEYVGAQCPKWPACIQHLSTPISLLPASTAYFVCERGHQSKLHPCPTCTEESAAQMCECGHSNEEHDDGRLCCFHQTSRSLWCSCREFKPVPSSQGDAVTTEESAAQTALFAKERERQAWEETAAQFSRNADYYRGLLDKIGETYGECAHIADDGIRSEDILRAKLPELAVSFSRVAAQMAEALQLAETVFFYIRNLSHKAWRDPPNLEAVCKSIENCATESRGKCEAALAAYLESCQQK